jgi:hypothetical protein
MCADAYGDGRWLFFGALSFLRGFVAACHAAKRHCRCVFN